MHQPSLLLGLHGVIVLAETTFPVSGSQYKDLKTGTSTSCKYCTIGSFHAVLFSYFHDLLPNHKDSNHENNCDST